MKRFPLILAVIAAVIELFAMAGLGAAASVDELVAAAKKEGALNFYAPSTLTPEGAQQVGQAFNKKYDLNVRVTYFPSGSMTQEVGKLISQAAAGVTPEYDLMAIIDALHGHLWLKKLHAPFDYAKLGVDPRAIHYDNGTVSFANQVVLPAYNERVLDPQDVPTRWEDLLAPKWKGKKIGIPTATGQIDFLAIKWGEKKVVEFAQALARQEPIPGRLAELYTRLQVGEILLTSTMLDSFIHRSKKKGAPLAQAQLQPVISPAYHAGVLKGARHPNTAHLFTAFLTSPEAQRIWEKHGGETSAFVPGTPMYNYAKDKDMIYLSQKDAEMVNRLVDEFGRIFGFRR